MNTYSHLWSALRAYYSARHEPENIRPLAEVYWRLMLSVSLILIVLSIGWGTWVFVDVLSIVTGQSAGPGKTPPVILDRTQLETVLNAYAARAQNFSAIEKAATPIADPSK